MAFDWVYNVGGGRPLILEFYSKDTESLHHGDLMNVESGEVDLAASDDATLAGVLVSAVDPTDYDDNNQALIAAVDSTTKLRVTVNPDAVYCDRRADTAARAAGVGLDLTGATGAQKFAAVSNTDFIVIRTSIAGEGTFAKIAHGEHYLDP